MIVSGGGQLGVVFVSVLELDAEGEGVEETPTFRLIISSRRIVEDDGASLFLPLSGSPVASLSLVLL
jgi:hypothetical protein